MLLRVPSSQRHTALSRLILQVLGQDFTGPHVGNIVGIIIHLE